MQKHLSKFYLVLISLFIMVCITGCDPMYQVGIWHLTYMLEPVNNNPLILAQSDCFGVCFPRFGYSTNGGLNWAELTDLTIGNLEYRELIDSSQDCLDSCEFTDKLDSEIKYKIISGKTLFRSLDNGRNWMNEVEIPKWNQYQINFIEKEYGSTSKAGYYSPIKGVNLYTVRGPFDAITDPLSKNLILAMGIEGILVKSQEGVFTWSEANGFTHVQTPTRLGMLAEISLHSWFSGIIYCLLFLIICFLQIKKEKRDYFSLIIAISSFLLAIIPQDFLTIPIENSIRSCTINFQFNCQKYSHLIYFLINALFVILMVFVIYMKIRNLHNIGVNSVTKIIKTSSFVGISYWIPLVAWSQGFPYSYGAAAFTSLILCMVTSIFCFSRYNKQILLPIQHKSFGGIS